LPIGKYLSADSSRASFAGKQIRQGIGLTANVPGGFDKGV